MPRGRLNYQVLSDLKDCQEQLFAHATDLPLVTYLILLERKKKKVISMFMDENMHIQKRMHVLTPKTDPKWEVTQLCIPWVTASTLCASAPPPVIQYCFFTL